MRKTKAKKRREYKGDAVVKGAVIGKVVLLETRVIDFPHYWINESQIAAEIARFHRALDKCRSQLEQIKSKLCQIQGRDHITILESHILFLQDDLLVRNTDAAIEKDHINAEWALHNILEEIRQAFSKISHDYIRDRKYDIGYVENAIQRNLMGKAQDFFPKIPKGAIVVAYDISPAETLHLIRYQVGGFITEMGGLNSHTAIVARSLEIPSVIGVKDIASKINAGEEVLLDANKGLVVVNPLVKEVKKYLKQEQQKQKSERLIKREASLKAITQDDHPMQVMANMELVEEIDLVKRSGADGVGLFRTEYLFLDQESIPSLKKQEMIYKTVLKGLKSFEVTIRTVDLGADKILPHQKYTDQSNPALGLRAIRFCMKEKQIFADQLKALLMASRHGQLKICIPMVSCIEEFRWVKKLVKEISNDLKKNKIKIADHIPLGVMIETPAATMEIDLLAKEADFFSVGTNDLIQYLLAVDRTNEMVSYLYTPLHPSVLRVLKKIIESAKLYNKEVTLCGEMAADPTYLLLLMALGFDRLSMNLASVPRIKKMIRSAQMSQALDLSKKVLTKSTYKENQRFLQNKMKELFPNTF